MLTGRVLYRWPVIRPHFELMIGVVRSHSGHINGVAQYANSKGIHSKLFVWSHSGHMTGVAQSHSGRITMVALHSNSKEIHPKVVIMPLLELMTGFTWSHSGHETGVALYANSKGPVLKPDDWGYLVT